MALVALFAISASAEVTTYDDAPAKSKGIQVSTNDLVVFYDGFTCPSAYIFKDIVKMTNGNASSALSSDLDFTYINGKTGKTYTIADIKELDVPEGITHIGGRVFQANTTIKKVSFPKTVETSGVAIFQGATGLEECVFEHGENDNFKSFPGYAFYNCSSLKAFSMPDCVTSMTEIATFTGCKQMTAFHFSKNLVTWYSGGGGSKNATFDDCEKMYFVNDAFTYDAIPEKPTVYYFPANLTNSIKADGSINGSDFSKNSAMRNCYALNDVLVFGTGVTSLTNEYFFQGGPVNKIVFLGDMVEIKTGRYWGTTTFYFANPNDKSLSDLTFTVYNNVTKTTVFCNAEGNTTHLVEKNLGTEATCITNEFVKTYCFCGALVENKEVENTKTGVHVWTTNDCTVSVKCTGDENCDAMSPANEKHALVHNFDYANGFDKAGVYNYYCENAGCTIADKAVRDAEKSPIITFKGYSTPETGNVKGINAGFKVEKDLLTLYNDLNEVDATLTIFMVNSKSNDVNISKILDGDTLELADGVKGINVKITSVNYTSISVEVRGFDDSEGGNFYTLNLITAIAVKTADGVHYVQAGLKNSPNTTQTVDGVDFNIVTANSIYNPTALS